MHRFFGTNFRAEAAAVAVFIVDDGNIVDHLAGIEIANGNAVAAV